MKKLFLLTAIASLTCLASILDIHAQTTAFTYQGQLNDAGAAANGIYDLAFSIYNAVTNGTQIANGLTNSATGVSNGLFTVTLDFGQGVFTGTNYWLQIGVRTNGNGSFISLNPRQSITPVPYAIYAPGAGAATTAAMAIRAGTSTTATNFFGSLAGDVTGTQTATLVASVGGQTAASLASGASAANSATSANTAGTIVKRDPSGNFSMGAATLSGALNLPAPATIYSGGNPILREDVSLNFFAGLLAGNLTLAGSDNTGVGNHALQGLTAGNNNTANGYAALNNNTTGSDNTANGYAALYSNTDGNYNTASGFGALTSNTTGGFNTANGKDALYSNTNGANNTANGYQSLVNNTSGNNNIAEGYLAGNNLTTGNYNIEIGNQGIVGESNTIRIGTQGTQTSAFMAGVYGASAAGGSVVYVNSGGQLGTAGSTSAGSVTVIAGSGLSGGGTVALGSSTTLSNAGVTSLTGNEDITVSAANGAVTLGDTATSANTANRIVKRDGSGNFSAGAVNLTGALTLPANNLTVGSNQLVLADGGLSTSQNVGIGVSVPLQKLHVAGNIQMDGNFFICTGGMYLFTGGNTYLNASDNGAVVVGSGTPGKSVNLTVTGDESVRTLTIRGGADIAEPFHMSTREIAEGSIVIIDEDNPGQLKLSYRAYDKRVAGIVSGANGIHPGLSLSQQGVLEGGQNVALSGRVYALADASNGAIKPGDLLTTSSLPGYCMKATDSSKAQGAMLGKAMGALKSGKGMVLVLVTLQ